MAAIRSTTKISPKWVRQARKCFLKLLRATCFPPEAFPGSAVHGFYDDQPASAHPQRFIEHDFRGCAVMEGQ
jgi:hypothetical protein